MTDTITSPSAIADRGRIKVNPIERWCSWCFHKDTQEPMKHNVFSRNLYRCNHCYHLNLSCFKCHKGMAKQFPNEAEKLCASCQGLISNWDVSKDGKSIDVPEKLALSRRCSWCLTASRHILLKKNYLKRNLYQCQSCAKTTLKCRKCKEGMSRGSDARSDQLCIKCQGVISNWDEDVKNNKDFTRNGWCSWCFENSTHNLHERNYVKRNVYSCSECTLKTLPCMMCEDGMARSGMAWDDSLCASCSRKGKKGGWLDIKARKEKVMEEARLVENVKSELKRNSVFRERALKEGVLRPFLLLVSMPPIIRNQVSSFLGFSTFTEDYFGDSHAESWHILHSKRVGMQSRCNQSYEKINLFGSNSNWFDILTRVANTVFQTEISQKLTNTSKLNDPTDPFIKNIEEIFLIELNRLVMSQMTEEQRQEIRLKAEGTDAAKQIFIKNTGFTSTEAAQYAFNVVSKIFNLKGKAKTVLFDQSTKLLATIGGGTSLAATTTAVGGLTAQLALLNTPIFFIGLYSLAKTGIHMIFGSTEGRLFVPVILLLNQRILLAAEGIKVEDYY